MTPGKFAVTDFFHNNAYSHDPRTQFMNWSLMANGAWDYPADTRGYTIGTVEEVRLWSFAFRAADVMEPTTANGPTFDTHIAKNHGLAFEFEHDHRGHRRNGAIRILAFENHEHAGTYRNAMRGSGKSPDFDATRHNGARKYGVGIKFEQEFSQDAGVFGRYGWSDGKTESWAFTEIDRSLSGGLSIRGRRWGRPRDTIGLGAARNYSFWRPPLVPGRRGTGFIIGDGNLNYAAEQIVETYYAVHVNTTWTITADFQRISNPAYNRDRGPVSVASLRVHWER
jgi:high affinity Mn2+ porin